MTRFHSERLSRAGRYWIKGRGAPALLPSLVALFLAFLSLVGCATAPPSHPGDLCSIYREKRGWYHAAMRQEERWNIPSSVPMAMMYQESSFRSTVRTKRTYILWIIPWGHVSTAYGYSQALDAVWKEYERSIGTSASRDKFADALNFMNWYITQTHRQNHVSVRDAMRQYLAYHEGWGGYQRRSYLRRPGLMTAARRVSRRAALYQRQFDGCKESLKAGFWERLFYWLF